MFQELAEVIALKSNTSAELFVNEMLIEIECVGVAQLETNPFYDQDDYSVEIKVGSWRVSGQIRKKIKANIVKELLNGIKKSLTI